MTSVVCRHCGKTFAVVSGLSQAECNHCKHMQQIPKTTAGKSARLSAATVGLDPKRKKTQKPTTGNSTLDGMVKAQLENARRKAEVAQDEDRVMKKTKKS